MISGRSPSPFPSPPFWGRIKGRYKRYYGEEREAEIQDEKMIEQLRGKWEDFSEAEGLLSMDFGLLEFGVKDAKERLSR